MRGNSFLPRLLSLRKKHRGILLTTRLPTANWHFVCGRGYWIPQNVYFLDFQKVYTTVCSPKFKIKWLWEFWNMKILTWNCDFQPVIFLRWAFVKWSHTFCTVQLDNTVSIFVTGNTWIRVWSCWVSEHAACGNWVRACVNKVTNTHGHVRVDFIYAGFARTKLRSLVTYGLWEGYTQFILL